MTTEGYFTSELLATSMYFSRMHFTFKFERPLSGE